MARACRWLRSPCLSVTKLGSPLAGFFTQISTLADVQENVMEYLHVLSRPKVIDQEHDVVWTEAYIDSTVSQLGPGGCDPGRCSFQKMPFVSLFPGRGFVSLCCTVCVAPWASEAHENPRRREYNQHIWKVSGQHRKLTLGSHLLQLLFFPSHVCTNSVVAMVMGMSDPVLAI